MRKVVSAALLLASACCARQPVHARHTMVVARETHATDVGDPVLASGGNAIDAALAVAFALAVTHPSGGTLTGTDRGFGVISSPPPDSGGAGILQMPGILEGIGIHHQWMPGEIRMEFGISPDTIELLQSIGYKVVQSRTYIGEIAAIVARTEAPAAGILERAPDGRVEATAKGH